MDKPKKKFRDTPFGKLVLEKIPGIAGLVGDLLPDSGVLGVVKNAIAKTKGLSEEDRLQLESAYMQFEKEIFALEIEDRKRASDMMVNLNQSEHASWLAKNTGPMIALAYTLFNFIIYIMILIGNFEVTTEIAVLIVNSITNIAMLVVGFYFGSSQERARSSSRTMYVNQQKAA